MSSKGVDVGATGNRRSVWARFEGDDLILSAGREGDDFEGRVALAGGVQSEEQIIAVLLECFQWARYGCELEWDSEDPAGEGGA